MSEREETTTYSRALNTVLLQEMRRNPAVFVFGQDIGFIGGRNGVTKGLLKEFGPHRVIDAPVNEELYIGIAIGAAQLGMYPVVEFAHSNLLLLAAADLFRGGFLQTIYGEQPRSPIVVRARYLPNFGPELSPHYFSLFSFFEGICVATPSTPRQAGGLLRRALRGTEPVIIFEDVRLYSVSAIVPREDYDVPFGKGEVRCAGEDISIITYSIFANFAVEAAKNLLEEGINAEVVDLVSISPLDSELILQSAAKTKCVLVVVGEPLSSSLIYHRIFMLLKERHPEVALQYFGPGEGTMVPFGPQYNGVFPTPRSIAERVTCIIDTLR